MSARNVPIQFKSSYSHTITTSKQTQDFDDGTTKNVKMVPIYDGGSILKEPFVPLVHLRKHSKHSIGSPIQKRKCFLAYYFSILQDMIGT